ncbi:long polar fimbrial protein LpfA [Salmonella enterica subsp. enterica serovar Java]|uniref:Long polar fimbrial protein LpfA n=1 Tax=Salmonella enterica subsp. enterica serovar Java TaxID=224729 RepID=A0A3Y9C5V8_SALEB|nr:long polar fimbrial protein LpfA [Salmonella enterica subsp. enterica serovar Java]ECG3202207.1 long polar fimbrial protein LpfA [Salmonella enterica subsp. enterica serovar Java]EDC4058180.1 fimbrial protein [Salmonella enterica subsp. enterica serovar Java]EIK6739822.1 fimbrial protein [Salmonella enterica subsp. enterica serovar Aqua]HCA3587963.1 fimbrial protein [Salmonella enterica subsp. enterica serovar Java]
MMSTVPAFADGEITASNAGGGTIQFTGSVINAPCSIKNQNINVDLGQVPAKKLKAVGATSQAQKIQIDLTDCSFEPTSPNPPTPDHGLLSKVDVEFTGITHTVDAANGIIGNEATTDKAKNVEIQLLRPDQSAYNLTTGPGLKTATQLDGGSNPVIFWAQMISKEGNATAGNVSANVTYKLHYY